MIRPFRALRATFLAFAISASVIPSFAADPPILLNWSQLVPKGGIVAKKSLFGPKPGASSAQPNVPEANWMSLKRQQPGAGAPPAVVADLDGKQVSIGGYVVPLDFENTSIKEFLLVPFVGACIHVPPPPANQIIYVKAEQGFTVSGPFDAVTVTGTLRATLASTGLAEAGYSLEATSVLPRS